ncbi:S8 family serine peptidase [Kribbella sp. NPDC026611]|uniref:S8 family serine peptidase n=1 Tax=Kribbella sp. NPDC026611 TaxID=3154911 RepID=UPI003408FA12
MTKTVTLITGDRVSLTGSVPSIQPGPGRTKLSFSATKVKGRLTVIPSDVRPLVDTGRLDRLLFDVTGLIESGYDDAHTAAVPVIIGYSKRKTRPALKALTTTRSFTSLNATAGKVSKQSAAAFLSTVATSPAVQHVWLDAKRHLLLDRSTKQIGAPAAWAAGYTGKGVRVAVIDSGIDKHPDLAPRIAGVKTFEGDVPGDQLGHGTHVASIIAGSGAASDGLYRGVAPDATLYDAKSCSDVVCDDSSVLAGMEWAARDMHAQVVNISLGFPGERPDDPLEQAINTLTAETGVLFVVAAGNIGPTGTILSPGRAAAALTVGAVDRDDTLAPFSSRGPAGAELKPDVTAPGVGIVAARSSEGTWGEPVNQYYTRLSGTSMAAPHVAGAAALLLQQHPDWKAPELKSALMNSAKPGPDQGIFDQGAGRIDVARAVAQPVIAGPASISFGSASFPHTDDQPVTRTLTYRNTGTTPVTLAVSTEFTAPNGTPAPVSALTVSAGHLTIPAGGSAPLQVTSNTNHNGADGRYVGQVVATWPDGGKVHVPVTVVKEIEAYDLTVNVTGPDGAPASSPSVNIWPLDGSTPTYVLADNGTARVRLTPGDYAVDAIIEGDATYGLVQPTVHVTADHTLTFDARQARKVAISVPQRGLHRSLQMADYIRTSPDGAIRIDQYLGAFDGKDLYTLGLGPALPANQFSSVIASDWYGPSTAYHTADKVDGRYPTGFQRTVRDQDLATITTTLNRVGGDGFQLTTAPTINDHQPFTLPSTLGAPATIVQHVDAGTAKWNQLVEETTAGDPVTVLTSAEPTTYRAGQTYRERWNAAVRSIGAVSATRADADLQVSLTRLADADGHLGDAATTAESAKLYRNDTLVTQSDNYSRVDADGLPPEQATYRFEASATRVGGQQLDYRATFNSQAGNATIPLWAIGYRPAVDNANTAQWTPTTRLPVLATGSTSAVRSLNVEYSGDGGTTWHAARVDCVGVRACQATFPTPKGSVSLRSTITDAAGTTATETIINAYAVTGG